MAKEPNKPGEPERVTIKPIAQEARTACGVVMPIADFEPYPKGHWNDVLAIVQEAVQEAGFEANLVSSEDAVGIIQHRIVQNLYDNEIVVVDVSGRNANVMFELGMRLAFDKPTVIIKDELTPYSFDTSAIEHLGYRSDLRYQSINTFKERLAAKVKSTHAARGDPGASTFLRNFGRFEPAKLGNRKGSEIDLVINELASLRRAISHPPTPPRVQTVESVNANLRPTKIRFRGTVEPDNISEVARVLGLRTMHIDTTADGTLLSFNVDRMNWPELKAKVATMFPEADVT